MGAKKYFFKIAQHCKKIKISNFQKKFKISNFQKKMGGAFLISEYCSAFKKLQKRFL